MIKNNFIGLFGVLCIFLMLFSCGKNTKKSNIIKNNKQSSLTLEIEYNIEFPDTVHINKAYSGSISYTSIFDTITTDFGNEEKYRYVIFRSLVSDSIDYDVAYLSTIVKDTFGAVTNKIIPLKDISFHKKGIFYIDGIIEDTAIINLHKKNEKGEDLERWLIKEFRATKKVVVIDKE
ncbi:hypothetical protein [Myroides sp. WP-1]|uniref:hypothetical protein n=1 Tax=Myroides sp. WP-1 TaxID=2759944 RepID=UPI0015FBE8FA|nr:hypothetical protein [Myroides sp. WP-1]MBB1140688.1 hypothetical protein [Myroides sp. WP-1]